MERKTPNIVQQLRKEEQEGVLDESTIESFNESKSSNNFGISQPQSDNITLDSFIKSAEESNAGIIISDNQGTILYINESYTKISGYSLEDIIGSNIEKLQSDAQSNHSHLLETIYSGSIWTGEIESKRKNNELYWQQTTIIPITDHQGNISFFMSVNEEITKRKQLEQSLRIKDNAILSSINAIVLTNLSGEITYVNPSFLKMWSFDSEKKVIGKPVFSLWNKGGEYANIMDTVFTRGGWLGEVVARNQKGRLFPVQMSASMVTDEQNNPLSIMASFVDITTQKRMEKNYKKFKKISDEADYGSVIYDLQGNIIYGNEAFARMHGYTTDEMIGNHLSILFKEDEQEIVQDLLTNLKEKGKLVGVEQWHIKKDGTSFPLLVTSTIIDDKRFHQPFIAGTMIDITKMKEAERKIIQNAEEVKQMNEKLNIAHEQLAVLNQNLERKVKERTTEIKKLLKQKDAFINQLGHDLRTPLTPMFALLPLLSEKVEDEKGKKYISMIRKNTLYMKSLVNKTITYAKLNTDNIQFTFSEINLYEFMVDIKEELNQYLVENQADVIISIDQSLIVFADNVQLKEVFQNLITNAIKYKKENQPVHITIDSVKNEENITISIADDGIGMTKEQLSNIFDEFYKADSARTDINSHGLGLNICKRIIEKHHGTIWVESEGLDKGSTFYFTLPVDIKAIEEEMKNE